MKAKKSQYGRRLMINAAVELMKKISTGVP